MMRVIAGSARGTKLECPPGEDVRPTPEMARGALFNILREDIDGARVLDLFAGAGTFGIEALSRGAESCVFVELSAEHKRYLEKNLQKTHLSDRATVLLRDAFRTPDAVKGQRFDLIFLGPPFPLLKMPGGLKRLVDLMNQLAENVLQADSAILIAQHDATDSMPETTPRLTRTDQRRYGRNVFSFYIVVKNN